MEKGWRRREKDMNDRSDDLSMLKFVAWLQKTQINSIFYLWENKKKQTETEMKIENQRL